MLELRDGGGGGMGNLEKCHFQRWREAGLITVAKTITPPLAGTECLPSPVTGLRALHKLSPHNKPMKLIPL